MTNAFQIIDVLLFSLLFSSFNLNFMQLQYSIILFILIFFTLLTIIIVIESYFGNKYTKNFYLIHNFSFPILLLSIFKIDNIFELSIKYSINIFSIFVCLSSIITYLLQINKKILFKWTKTAYILINLIIFSLFTESNYKQVNIIYITISIIVYHFIILQYLINIICCKKDNFKQFGELNIFSQITSFLLLISILKINYIDINKEIEWKSCIYYITLIMIIFLPIIFNGISISFNNEYKKKNSSKFISVFLIILTICLPIYYLIIFSLKICKFIINIIKIYTEVKFLIFYWILILLILILFFIFGYNPLISDSKKKRIFIRKTFHLVLISLFLPPLFIFNKSIKNNENIQKILEFTIISIYIVSNILIYLEIFRKSQFIKIFAKFFNNLLIPFIDEKDNVDGIIVTHICLLIGISLPIFKEFLIYDKNIEFDMVSANIGFITIGIGDAFSAIFGILFGNTRLPGNKEKTIIGMIAFFISSYISLQIIVYFSSCYEYSLLKLFIICFISSLLEAYTHHIDNATIPIYSLAIYTNIK